MNLKSKIFHSLIGICFVASAQANPMQFSIYTLDENVSTYKLDDSPKIEVKDDHIIIFNNSIEIKFDFANLQKLVYQSSSSNIDAIQKTLQPVLFLDNNIININPLEKEAQIDIYDTKGILLKSSILEANQLHEISISNLNQGLYIININNTSYKFLKK